jgi:hypothetical protein
LNIQAYSFPLPLRIDLSKEGRNRVKIDGKVSNLNPGTKQGAVGNKTVSPPE